MTLATPTDHPHTGEQHSCWVCPFCKGDMIETNEYVGGRGYLPHLQCRTLGCMFSASLAYMIRQFGLCGRARVKAA